MEVADGLPASFSHLELGGEGDERGEVVDGGDGDGEGLALEGVAADVADVDHDDLTDGLATNLAFRDVPGR